MPQQRTKSRRSRNGKLPFPDLDLKQRGLLEFEFTLQVKLRRQAIQHLRRLAPKASPDHVWTSRTYTRSGELHGVTLVVHFGGGKRLTILQISYRRNRRPRKPTVDFDRVWGLVPFVSESEPMDAVVSAEVEMTPARIAALPLALPLSGVIPEAVGYVKGVEIVREQDGKRLFEVYVDLEADGSLGMALVFRRDAHQVATAAEDLLKAVVELLGVFLVGRSDRGS